MGRAGVMTCPSPVGPRVPAATSFVLWDDVRSIFFSERAYLNGHEPGLKNIVHFECLESTQKDGQRTIDPFASNPVFTF